MALVTQQHSLPAAASVLVQQPVQKVIQLQSGPGPRTPQSEYGEAETVPGKASPQLRRRERG